MALSLASADSWNWYVGVLDLATGEVKRLNVRPDLDYQCGVDGGRPHHRLQHGNESRALEIQ